MSTDKHYEPTAQKLTKARKEGRVFKPRIAVQLVGLLFGFIGLYFIPSFFWVEFKILLKYIENPCIDKLELFFEKAMYTWLVTISLFLTLVSVGSIAVQLFTAGSLFQLNIACMKLERISFASNLMNIFKSLKEIPIKIIFAIIVFYLTYCNIDLIIIATNFEYFSINNNSIIFNELYYFSLKLLVLFALYAGIDYFLQRRSYLKELRMTRQEVLNDQKENDGDPLFKHYRRQLHEQMTLADLIKQIKKSKIVVVERI
jgi:flagellar biosynthesis protein FlhB